MNSNETETTVPIPIHSQISVVPATATEPAKTVVTLAAASELKSVSRSESVITPTSHVPASPTDYAKAKGVFGLYILGGLFAVASLFSIYRAHFKVAGICALGAFAVPALGNLISSEIGYRTGIALGAIGLTLFVAWHLMKSKLAVNPFTNEHPKSTSN